MENIGVVHGRWGEDVAVAQLRREGLQIMARNVRPCAYDRRLEIDIVAYDRQTDAAVFVEVKQHASHREGEGLLRSVDKRKRRLLRTACDAWRRSNRWRGAYRFDVVEVYGVPGGDLPEILHVRRVNLFVPPSRFAPGI